MMRRGGGYGGGGENKIRLYFQKEAVVTSNENVVRRRRKKMEVRRRVRSEISVPISVLLPIRRKVGEWKGCEDYSRRMLRRTRKKSSDKDNMIKVSELLNGMNSVTCSSEKNSLDYLIRIDSYADHNNLSCRMSIPVWIFSVFKMYWAQTQSGTRPSGC